MRIAETHTGPDHRAPILAHGGRKQPGSLAPPAAATIAALLFPSHFQRPCIHLVGAPRRKRLSSNVRLSRRVPDDGRRRGVRGSLAIASAAIPVPNGLDAHWDAIVIAIAAFVLLQWPRMDAIWVIAGGAAAGLVLAFV